jgi:hypothetical protein
MPAPSDDPRFDALTSSFGAGVLGRVREDGSARVDGSLSARVTWRWVAALAELVATRAGAFELGGHAEVTVTPIDRVAVTARGEIDGGAPGGGEWSVAGGVGWHVTRDRRNRLVLIGWVRRDRDRDSPYDGVVVFLQASL